MGSCERQKGGGPKTCCEGDKCSRERPRRVERRWCEPGAQRAKVVWGQTPGSAEKKVVNRRVERRRKAPRVTPWVGLKKVVDPERAGEGAKRLAGVPPWWALWEKSVVTPSPSGDKHKWFHAVKPVWLLGKNVLDTSLQPQSNGPVALNPLGCVCGKIVVRSRDLCNKGSQMVPLG